MSAPEIRAFLSWLATRRNASASTQNQALSALLFLYRQVLRIELGALEPVTRAKRPVRVPVVLTEEEAAGLLSKLEGVAWLIGALLYGSGLRLQECLELRVKDIDFAQREILVRRGKGQKDRRTMLPAAFALDRKYPNAAIEWKWQFVFPAARICRDPRWGPPSRYHLHESAIQRAVADAARRHPNRAGAARPCGRLDDHDVPARTEWGWPWRPKPPRSTLTRGPSTWLRSGAANRRRPCAAVYRSPPMP